MRVKASLARLERRIEAAPRREQIAVIEALGVWSCAQLGVPCGGVEVIELARRPGLLRIYLIRRTVQDWAADVWPPPCQTILNLVEPEPDGRRVRTASMVPFERWSFEKPHLYAWVMQARDPDAPLTVPARRPSGQHGWRCGGVEYFVGHQDREPPEVRAGRGEAHLDTFDSDDDPHDVESLGYMANHALNGGRSGDSWKAEYLKRSIERCRELGFDLDKLKALDFHPEPESAT